MPYVFFTAAPDMDDADVTAELQAMGMDNPIQFKAPTSGERCYLGPAIQSSGAFVIVTVLGPASAKTRKDSWT